MTAALLVGGISCSRGDDDEKKDDAATSTTAGEQLTSTMSNTEVLGVDSQFARFAELIEAAGIAGELDDSDAVTIFAPSTEAIDALGADEVDAMKGDPTEASAFVKRHVVDAKLSFNDLVQASGTELETIGGRSLPVTYANGQLAVDGVAITKTDIVTDNGVIHVLGAVVP